VILYVDNEHASTYERPGTDWLLAARARITYRLGDLADDICLLARYQDVDAELIERHGIEAMFISGHGAPPEAYDETQREGLRAVITDRDLPVFGFCGGLQFIASALGVEPVRMGRLPDGADDPHPDYEPGWITELGYEPVSLVGEHPLHDGLGAEPVFRHAHSYHLPQLPGGFVRLAETDACPIQLAAHGERRLAGAQFHPEYWTDDAPAGERLILNFLNWAGLR
jgi:GMP synthase (glutamine-hydrolysing)